mgnify:CR=1 FL=1
MTSSSFPIVRAPSGAILLNLDQLDHVINRELPAGLGQGLRRHKGMRHPGGTGGHRDDASGPGRGGRRRLGGRGAEVGGLPLGPCQEGLGVRQRLADRGLEEAIQAMAYLDDAILLIVGGGDVMSALKKEVIRLGLYNKVVFAGKFFPDELPSITPLADLGLS